MIRINSKFLLSYANSTTEEHQKLLCENFIKKFKFNDLNNKKLPREFRVNIPDLLKLMNFKRNRLITLMQNKKTISLMTENIKKKLSLVSSKENKKENTQFKKKSEQSSIIQTIPDSEVSSKSIKIDQNSESDFLFEPLEFLTPIATLNWITLKYRFYLFRAQCGTVTTIDSAKIGAFARLMNEKLDTADTNARRNYIRSIIDTIEVDDTAIRIIGSKDVLQAVIADKQTANGNVRGFVRKWRARRDSNS